MCGGGKAADALWCMAEIAETAGEIAMGILRHAMTAVALLGTSLAAQARPSGDPNVARILYQEARSFRASGKVLLAMFEAAVTESGMRNLRWGDRDSRGVFQIRVRYWGWATATNVHLSARWFLRRAIPRQWRYGSAGALAQAVEVSARPWLYNRNGGWARAWIRYVGGR